MRRRRRGRGRNNYLEIYNYYILLLYTILRMLWSLEYNITGAKTPKAVLDIFFGAKNVIYDGDFEAGVKKTIASYNSEKLEVLIETLKKKYNNLAATTKTEAERAVLKNFGKVFIKLNGMLTAKQAVEAEAAKEAENAANKAAEEQNAPALSLEELLAQTEKETAEAAAMTDAQIAEKEANAAKETADAAAKVQAQKENEAKELAFITEIYKFFGKTAPSVAEYNGKNPNADGPNGFLTPEIKVSLLGTKKFKPMEFVQFDKVKNIVERIKIYFNIYLRLTNKDPSTNMDEVYNQIVEATASSNASAADKILLDQIAYNKVKANQILKETDKYASLQCDVPTAPQTGKLGLFGYGGRPSIQAGGAYLWETKAAPVVDVDHPDLDKDMFLKVGDETLDDVLKKSMAYLETIESAKTELKTIYDMQCPPQPEVAEQSTSTKEPMSTSTKEPTAGGSRRRRKTTKKRSKKSKKRRSSKK